MESPRPHSKFKWPHAIGVSLLAIQLAMIIYARFSDARYFCWAPHDAQNEFFIEVDLGGRNLLAQEIIKRYRLPQQGVDPRAIRHIKDIIERYETTHGKNDNARVILRYEKNGIEQPAWYWPKR